MNFLDWIKSKLMKKNNLQLDEVCINNCKSKNIYYEEAMKLYEKVKSELIDFSDYKKIFSNDIVKIGEKYFEEKYIVDQKKLDEFTYVTVIEDGDEHEIKIVIKDGNVCDLSCTCSNFNENEEHVNCKHIYAILKHVCRFYNKNYLWKRCKEILMDYSKKTIEIEKKIDKKYFNEKNLIRYNEAFQKNELILQKVKDAYEKGNGEEDFLIMLKETLAFLGERLDLLYELLESEEKIMESYLEEIKSCCKNNVNGKNYKELMNFYNETVDEMIDISKYNKLFTNEVIEQGEKYSNDNPIENVNKVDEYTYNVIVKDTEDYEIKVMLKDKNICELNCTCSSSNTDKESNCKHIYVALKTVCDYYNREFISEKYQNKLNECLNKTIEICDKLKIEQLDKKDLKRYECLEEKIDKLKQIMEHSINLQITVKEALNIMNVFCIGFGYILDELEDILDAQEKAYKEKLSSEKYRKKLKRKYKKMLERYKKED